MMNENLAARPFFKDAPTLVAIHEFIPWEGKAATAEVQDYGNFLPLYAKRSLLPILSVYHRAAELGLPLIRSSGRFDVRYPQGGWIKERPRLLLSRNERSTTQGGFSLITYWRSNAKL